MKASAINFVKSKIYIVLQNQLWQNLHIIAEQFLLLFVWRPIWPFIGPAVHWWFSRYPLVWGIFGYYHFGTFAQPFVKLWIVGWKQRQRVSEVLWNLALPFGLSIWVWEVWSIPTVALHFPFGLIVIFAWSKTYSKIYGWATYALFCCSLKVGFDIYVLILALDLWFQSTFYAYLILDEDTALWS